MTGFITGLIIGLIAGGAVVWIYKAKAQTVAADVKKDFSA